MSDPKLPDEAAIPLDGGDDEPIRLTADAPPPPPPPRPADDEDEPISLVGEVSGQVRQSTALGEQVRAHKDYQRSLNLNGAGATRCRIFHSKIADTSLAGLEEQINNWLDSEDVEVKSVGHNIGTLQGKLAEENLIVTVWY
ncbi:MAG: hypothetical protein ACYTFO_04245 [Planctomycetota bacterium]|jgi:hypothetical protein